MEVLYVNEQIKNKNGVIISSGKFGPFESRAELDYFRSFKQSNGEDCGDFYELKIESVNFQKGQKPSYVNKYTNEQLAKLLKKELNHLKFLGCNDDAEMQRKMRVISVFLNSAEIANCSFDKNLQTKINKMLNYYLIFKKSKNCKGLDFEIKNISNEFLDTIVNFNKKQKLHLDSSLSL